MATQYFKRNLSLCIGTTQRDGMGREEGGGFERVTGRKARGLQMEEIVCKCPTSFSLLSGRRKQTSNIFFLLYTNLKGGFS